MATVDEIVSKAWSVRERANDLRALETLGLNPDGNAGGLPIHPDDVSAWDDTGTARWDHWREEYNLGSSGIDSSRFGEEFDYLPSLFADLSEANHDAYSSIITDLDAVAQALVIDTEEAIDHPAISKMDNQDDKWTGSFITAYESFFVSKLPFHLPLQKWLVQELLATVRAHWNIVEGARESLLAIATGTEKALKNAIGEYAEDEMPDAATVLLAVAGAALAIAGTAAALPAGTGVALTLGVLGSINATGNLVKTLAGEIEGEDLVEKEEFGITGTTVDEIISSMNDALSRLSQVIATEESGLADSVQESIDGIDTYRTAGGPGDKESNKLLPMRLGLVDNVPEPDSDEMSHVD